MKAILRIFKYARRRLIALAKENRKLKFEIELYKEVVKAYYEKKH